MHLSRQTQHLLLLACTLAIAACTSAPRVPVSENELQAEKNVTLAGSLSADALPQLRKERAVVVDLRTAAEGTDVEAAQMQEAGIAYYNIPIGRTGLPENATTELNSVLAAHPGQPLVLHCRSGNRAALIWAAHLVESGQSNDDALATVDGIIGVDAIRTAILQYQKESDND